MKRAVDTGWEVLPGKSRETSAAPGASKVFSREYQGQTNGAFETPE